MAASIFPFTSMTFSISKPRWGTSSVIISLEPTGEYSLRLKRVVNGVSAFEDVRDYAAESATALDTWIRTLGFYDEGMSRETVPSAGTWMLMVSSADRPLLKQEGSRYPESFPDLLTTMIGLGLPGFERANAAMFLADFLEPHPSSPEPAAINQTVPMIGGAEFKSMLTDIARDPSKAEDMLREQFKPLSPAERQQLLEYVKMTDPAHYDWWRRILLG